MRIALFGGTFDPVHKAHLAVARAARDRFQLDTVLLSPAAVPPHKLSRTTEAWKHRFRMVELACEGETGLSASPLEAGSETSYSVVTLEKLRSSLPDENGLFFLIGADAFAEIRTWHRWQDVLDMVEFIVVDRPGHEWTTPEGARIRKLDGVHLTISSSEIRRKLAKCEPPAELPKPVFEYIQAHKLYGYASACPAHPVLPLSGDPVSH